MSKIIIDDPHSDPGYRYSSKTSANDTTGQWITSKSTILLLVWNGLLGNLGCLDVPHGVTRYAPKENGPVHNVLIYINYRVWFQP